MSRARTHSVWWLVAVMAGSSAILMATRLMWLRPTGVHPHVPWWVLIPIFGAAEVFVVLLRSRRGAHSISLSEIPLIIGLAFVWPVGVVLARMIGGGVAIAVHRRQRGVKFAFNLAHFALESTVAVVVFHTILGRSDPGSPIGWFAAFAVTLLLDLLGAATITAAISMSQGGYERGMLTETARDGAGAAVASTSLALVALLVLERDPRAIGLLAVVAAILHMAYRAYSGLGESHSRMELLYGFTTQVGESVQIDAVQQAVLAEAREALNATSASLVVREELTTRRVTLGGDDVVSEAVDEEAPWWAGALDGLPVVQSRRPQQRRPGDTEGLAVPLSRSGQNVGCLMVEGHVDDVSTFDTDDLRLLETLANHASISLEKTHLVEELRQRAQEQSHDARHDPLTGLPNRRWFVEIVDEALRRPDASAAVMLVDLDRFKEVNDTLGHHVGDELLRHVGRRLSQALGDAGTIARLGGDEFAAFVPGVESATAALESTQALLRSLHEPVMLGDLEIDVRASIGVSIFPDHGRDSSMLLQRADVAMYEAKTGHTEAAVYDKDHDPYSPQRLALASELRRTVEADELEVWFQPKVLIDGQRPIGAEALVRWNHPDLGMVQPDDFIPLAENIGLIRPLTASVVRVALRHCAAWHARGWDLGVAVNITARSLLDDGLLRTVTAELETAGIAPHYLTLEITENSMMVDPQRSLQVLRRLHESGIRLAIDDFGTGYSSLAYMKDLPVDEVKIDKSFVLELPDDPSDLTIVSSTIGLVQSLGLEVVAEGVETEAALEWLRDAGCDVAQGFLFSRPVPADVFAAWISRHLGDPAPASSGSESVIDEITREIGAPATAAD
jgi:diguanylate cyclase (GGDEF)-like protein